MPDSERTNLQFGAEAEFGGCVGGTPQQLTSPLRVADSTHAQSHYSDMQPRQKIGRRLWVTPHDETLVCDLGGIYMYTMPTQQCCPDFYPLMRTKAPKPKNLGFDHEGGHIKHKR